MDPKKRTQLLKVLGTVAVLAIAFFTLREKFPSLSDVGRALKLVSPWWLVLAVAAEIVSIALFARQQRRLLTGFGVTMKRRRAVALAYSRSAMAISLPAGSAVSAAYAMRKFREIGADRKTSIAAMVISGLLSFAGLAILFSFGTLVLGASRLVKMWSQDTWVVLAIAIVALIGLAVAIHFLSHRHHQRRTRRGSQTMQRMRVSKPRTAAVIDNLRDAVNTSRSVAPRHWALATAAAVGNWAMDLLCLYAVARGFSLEVSFVQIATVYLAVQVVRQIPLTPGGIGVIELSLLAGLVSAGANSSLAAATVLTYRMLSCWLILPVGFVGWLALRERKPSDLDEPTPEHVIVSA